MGTSKNLTVPRVGASALDPATFGGDAEAEEDVDYAAVCLLRPRHASGGPGSTPGLTGSHAPNTTQIINEMADDELKDACLECDLGAPDTDDFNVDAMRQALRVHYGVSLLQCVTSRPLRVVCCTIPA